MGVIINFQKVIATASNHTCFFSLLKEKGQITYDWVSDQLFVQDGEKLILITVVEFKKITGIKSFGQEDLVILLMANGLNVNVIVAENSFKSNADQIKYFNDLLWIAQQLPI